MGSSKAGKKGDEGLTEESSNRPTGRRHPTLSPPLARAVYRRARRWPCLRACPDRQFRPGIPAQTPPPTIIIETCLPVHRPKCRVVVVVVTLSPVPTRPRRCPSTFLSPRMSVVRTGHHLPPEMVCRVLSLRGSSLWGVAVVAAAKRRDSCRGRMGVRSRRQICCMNISHSVWMTGKFCFLGINYS